jgi:sugar lactone lactonase YvrE
VFVADAGNRCVHRFDLTGDYITEIGRRDPEGGFLGLLCPSPHLDCVVAADGTLRINNPGRLRVESYTTNGELLSSWGEAGMGAEHFCGCCNPTDIALMPDGRIVTAEKGIPRLKVYDAAGGMLAYVPPASFSADAAGMDIAVGPDGLIYVADPPASLVHVFRLDAAGGTDGG